MFPVDGVPHLRQRLSLDEPPTQTVSGSEQVWSAQQGWPAPPQSWQRSTPPEYRQMAPASLQRDCPGQHGSPRPPHL